MSIFQFSPPRGGRPTTQGATSARTRQFQYSPPRGGRHTSDNHSHARTGYFNSRPRVGGVSIFIQMQAAVYVHNRRNKYYK